MKIKNVDMLHGNLFKSIIIYSIPVLLMGLVQKLFGAVDIMVLSIVADTRAVAAVGSSSTIIHLLVDTFFGIAIGARVVLARLIGEGDENKVAKATATSLYTAVIIGVITAVIGFILTPQFLVWTDCPTGPDGCFEQSVTYMRWYLIAAPFMLLYNYGSAILSVSGDTQRPLYYMILSGATNVVLNFVLCLILPEKVAAVAIATAVSQTLGAILVILRIFRMDGPCRMSPQRLRWSNRAFGQIMRHGLPVGLVNALFPLSNLQIVAQVNSFGTAVMAGNAALNQLDGILSTIVATPWATALTAFAGQNLGAKQNERVKKSIVYCIGLSAILSIAFVVIFSLFSEPLISLFTRDPQAIAAAQIKAKYTMRVYFLIAVNACVARVIQVFGYPFLQTANSILSVFVFRFFWTEVIYANTPTLDVLFLCYTVSWLMMLTINTILAVYLYQFRFKKGKLKKIG